MSSLGLEGDSIIYAGESSKKRDGPKRQPKGKPPSRNKNNNTSRGADFDIESYLDKKRK